MDTRLKPLAKREQGMTLVGYAIMLSLMAIGAALADPMTRAKVVLLFRHAMRAMNAG